MQAKSKQLKRKSRLSQLLKKMERAEEGIGGVVVDKDPKRAALELKAIGITKIVKKEGIS